MNRLFGVQSQLPSFLANTHRLCAPRDCEYYLQQEATIARQQRQIEALTAGLQKVSNKIEVAERQLKMAEKGR